MRPALRHGKRRVYLSVALCSEVHLSRSQARQRTREGGRQRNLREMPPARPGTGTPRAALSATLLARSPETEKGGWQTEKSEGKATSTTWLSLSATLFPLAGPVITGKGEGGRQRNLGEMQPTSTAWHTTGCPVCRPFPARRPGNGKRRVADREIWGKCNQHDLVIPVCHPFPARRPGNGKGRVAERKI